MAAPLEKVPGKAWVVTFAGTAINLCLGILYAWSVWGAKLTVPKLPDGKFNEALLGSALPGTRFCLDVPEQRSGCDPLFIVCSHLRSFDDPRRKDPGQIRPQSWSYPRWAVPCRWVHRRRSHEELHRTDHRFRDNGRDRHGHRLRRSHPRRVEMVWSP